MVENNGKIETQIPITDKDSQEIIIDIVMEGKSAYDMAVEKGFDGTLEEWLLSLHGKDGKDADVDGIQAQFDTVGARLDSTDAQLNNMTQDFTQHKLDYTSQRQQDQLKVAKVEKDINDYQQVMSQVNVNQEAKQDVSGYGVVSLPKNSANGHVGASVKGRTLKNELNYNRDTWAEWGLFHGSVVEDNNLKIIESSAKSVTLNTNFKTNTKYGFIFYKVNLGVSRLSLSSSSAFDTNFFFTSNLTGSQHVKAIETTKLEITSNELSLFTNLNSEEPMVIKDIRCFELPTGSEIENDFETMTADELAQKYPYINGDSTKSTISASRLKSVGKNLFNKSKSVFGKYIRASDGVLANSGIKSVSDYILLKPNTTYRFSESDSLVLYDMKKNYISGVASNQVTTPNYPVYIRTTVENTDTYMIVEGDILGEYEPYAESAQYLPNVGELRSLPNGVKDEIRVSGGKAELIKRTSQTKLSSLAYGNINQRTNVDEIRYNRPNDMATGGPTATGSATIEGLTEVSSDVDDVVNIGKFATNTTFGYIGFIVAKGTTKVQFENSINMSATLTYQLAEPIITPIDVSGNLISYPSGTIYIEPYTTVAGIYNSDISILANELPIASIDKISKIDFTTGNETILDVSKAVIDVNKLSFTHPDLVDGDIVFFEYMYLQEITTLGESTIEYFDSRYTIKDSIVPNKFYKWELTVANGIPAINLVEVL